MASTAVNFRTSSYFDKSVAAHPEIRNKLKDFFAFKQENPIQQFGGSDKPFVGKGAFAKKVPGLMHAHLNRDLSVVYRVHSKNPTMIDLYGVFSHADLGTSNTANIKKQKSSAERFAQTSF